MRNSRVPFTDRERGIHQRQGSVRKHVPTRLLREFLKKLIQPSDDVPQVVNFSTANHGVLSSSPPRQHKPDFDVRIQPFPFVHAFIDAQPPTGLLPQFGPWGTDFRTEALPMQKWRVQDVTGRLLIQIGLTKPKEAEEGLRKRILRQRPMQAGTKRNALLMENSRNQIGIPDHRPSHDADVPKRNLPFLHHGADFFGNRFNLVAGAGDRDQTTDSSVHADPVPRMLVVRF